MKPAPSDRFGAAPDVLSKKVGGQQVLLDLRTGHYFGLDEAGAQVWQLMEEGHSIEAICDALLEDYAAEREVIEGDTLDLFSRLIDRALVVRQPS